MWTNISVTIEFNHEDRQQNGQSLDHILRGVPRNGATSCVIQPANPVNIGRVYFVALN